MFKKRAFLISLYRPGFDFSKILGGRKLSTNVVFKTDPLRKNVVTLILNQEEIDFFGLQAKVLGKSVICINCEVQK